MKRVCLAAALHALAMPAAAQDPAPLRQKRSLDAVPTQNWFEGSVGRELGSGFSLDVGYQYARYVDEESGGRGTSHSALARLRYTGGLL